MVKTGIRWPVSRVLFTTCVDWRPFLWDDDCSSPRATDPEDGVKTHRMSSLFGLAPGGVYLARSVARSAVRSYRTLSPLPRRFGAVCFLWHFPSARAGRALPAALSAWSPDFPPFRPKPEQRPPGHLIRRAHSLKAAGLPLQENRTFIRKIVLFVDTS